MAGVAIPGWIEGRSLVGPHATRRDVVVAAADRMDDVPGCGRSVRDGRFRHVRNVLPWLDGDDLPDCAAGVPITGELRAARATGDPDVRLAALVAIDRLGDRGRRLWPTVAAVEVGDDEEYSRRTIERIRGRLAEAAP